MLTQTTTSLSPTPSITAVPTPPMMLSIQNVGKQFRNKNWGLRDFTLELGPGVLGLLGPNGAGKSTLMRILATITRATTGAVTWNGKDIARSPDDLRAVLGYLPQDFGVYPNLSVYLALADPDLVGYGQPRESLQRGAAGLLFCRSAGKTTPSLVAGWIHRNRVDGRRGSNQVIECRGWRRFARLAFCPAVYPNPCCSIRHME